MRTMAMLKHLELAGLKFEVLSGGEDDPRLGAPSSIERAGIDSICFTLRAGDELLDGLDAVGVGLVFIPIMARASSRAVRPYGCVVVATKSPKLAFAHVLAMHSLAPAPGVHPTAVVEGWVAETAHVGAFAYIGPECSVGDGSIIGPRATLVRNVVVGARCNIMAGAIIGASGFGYARQDDGSLKALAHLGSVVIGDDVDVGPGTNINRDVLGVTTIRRGSKLDALCHIGHGADIGPHAALAAGTIMGRSRVEAEAWIGMNATVLPGADVGARATVAAHAVLTTSVGAGVTVVGSPARVIDRERKPGAMW